MPRKKSVKRAAQSFCSDLRQIRSQIGRIRANGLAERDLSWVYEYAIIRLHSSFERLITEAIVGAVNNDMSTLAERTGVHFPKHLTDEVCEFLVTGGKFLDFKGRNGLIQAVKEYVPDSHYLVRVVKNREFERALDHLSALRNFAAHRSKVAKRAVIKALGISKLSSSGDWLRRQNRFEDLANKIERMAESIETAAPY